MSNQVNLKAGQYIPYSLYPSELFDLVKYMFTNRLLIMKFPKRLIQNKAYMINRILSIGYPEQAQVLQTSIKNPIQLIYAWVGFFEGMGANSVPKFVYTKTKVTSKPQDKEEITEEEWKEFAKFQKYSWKDVKFCLSLYSLKDELINEYREYKELMNEVSSKVKKERLRKTDE